MNIAINNNLNYNNNVSFSGRCPQIKDAQWVCHKISSEFPHISTTRLKPFFDKLEEDNIELFSEYVSTNSFWHAEQKVKNKKDKKLLTLFNWHRAIIGQINMARSHRPLGFKNDYCRITNIIFQLKYDKLGNCYENAKMAECIMKMNGFKNVYTSALKCENYPVDHYVCVFNKDGSEFNGKIGKKTIIIDPWLGLVDFTGNIFKKYINEFSDFIYIPKNKGIEFRELNHLHLTDEDIQNLRKDFPELIYPLGQKKFMA